MDSSLIIKADSIREARQPFKRELSVDFIEAALEAAPGWSARSGGELDVRLTKMNPRNVLLEGSLSVGVKSACRRCLREVESAVPTNFMLSLVNRDEGTKSGRQEVEDDGEGSQAGTFGDEEADEERFDGEKIDLGPIVREQLLLALPAIEPLCKEECRGLCTTCGQDLNERDCGHDQKPPDPRWGALKNIKLN